MVKLGRLCLLISIVLLVSCSATKQSGDSESGVQSFGNRVLQFVGVLPPTKVVEGMPDLVGQNKTLTREEEYYLGRAVSASILSRYKTREDAALQEYLNEVGRAVASFSDMPETFGGYHFAIIESDELNAVSAPGGNVFVTRGLILRMPDEDSLAAVLAHEVAHIQNQHGIKSISREHGSNALTKVGAVTAALSCNVALAQGVVVFGAAVDDIVDKLLVSGYSKDQEYEADLVALQILNRAGYNPHALVSMLEILHGLEQSKQGGWFSTHPKPSDRIEHANAAIVSNHYDENLKGKVERARRFQGIIS